MNCINVSLCMTLTKWYIDTDTEKKSEFSYSFYIIFESLLPCIAENEVNSCHCIVPPSLM